MAAIEAAHRATLQAALGWIGQPGADSRPERLRRGQNCEHDAIRLGHGTFPPHLGHSHIDVGPPAQIADQAVWASRLWEPYALGHFDYAQTRARPVLNPQHGVLFLWKMLVANKELVSLTPGHVLRPEYYGRDRSAVEQNYEVLKAQARRAAAILPDGGYQLSCGTESTSDAALISTVGAALASYVKIDGSLAGDHPTYVHPGLSATGSLLFGTPRLSVMVTRAVAGWTPEPWRWDELAAVVTAGYP